MSCFSILHLHNKQVSYQTDEKFVTLYPCETSCVLTTSLFFNMLMVCDGCYIYRNTLPHSIIENLLKWNAVMLKPLFLTFINFNLSLLSQSVIPEVLTHRLPCTIQIEKCEENL